MDTPNMVTTERRKEKIQDRLEACRIIQREIKRLTPLLSPLDLENALEGLSCDCVALVEKEMASVYVNIRTALYALR